jgi:GGDEF domain-containing protein
LSKPFMIDGHQLRLGASIGRAVFPIDAEDPDGLLRCADTAMFAVKRERRSAHARGSAFAHPASRR